MEKHSSRNRERRKRVARPRIPPKRLEGMIEEAIVDAYTESEQAGGFHVMIEQELDLPFETTVLGVTVSVKRVDITEANEAWRLLNSLAERRHVAIAFRIDRHVVDPA